MNMTGKVWKFGDNVDTDAIVPARYLSLAAADELALHCMEGIDPQFAGQVQQGDIIVAGANFGCGSSREHAPLSLKGAGIGCIVAVSFARIFYRSAINVGLPILECPPAVLEAEMGDTLTVELSTGTITNLRSGHVYRAAPFPGLITDIVEAGGLIPLTKKRLQAQSKDAAQSPQSL
jgi:3-isopropylmalate/(R)-2-methylmalate dehydratase small subunit